MAVVLVLAIAAHGLPLESLDQASEGFRNAAGTST
jgi:hypothetical protein